jgi:hypothetical protein
VGIRARKNSLIAGLKVRALAVQMPKEQVDTFELMFRRARSEDEQNEVSKALDAHMNGWKTGTDAWSRILQASNDTDFLSGADEDEDPPGLKAALARSQVFLGKKGADLAVDLMAEQRKKP